MTLKVAPGLEVGQQRVAELDVAVDLPERGERRPERREHGVIDDLQSGTGAPPQALAKLSAPVSGGVPSHVHEAGERGPQCGDDPVGTDPDPTLDS